MRTVFLLFLVLFTGTAGAQTVLKIEAVDKMTKDPVQHAMVFVHTSAARMEKPLYTGRNGVAYYTVSGKDSLQIRCEHTAYGPETKQLAPKDLNRDTLKVTILMRFEKVTSLDEFVVRPDGVPVAVYQSERLSVDDFEFLPDGRMLLLTYARNKKKGTELYLFDGTEVQSEIPLENEETGLELIRDYRGNPHVVTAKSVYGITTENNRVFVGGLEKDYFMTYIAPIVDTTVSKYFFSNFNPLYPAFDYFTFDWVDSSYRKIAQVEDELMMELYRSEYKWVNVREKIWAKDMEHQTGIDAEIWIGATYFTQSIYYKELYAPMFERNDTIFLFDHYKNLMFRYNAIGDAIDSIPIFYHLQPKQTGWKKQLIQDQVTGQVYIVYEKAGQYSLRRIDLATGELKEAIPLHYRYPDNILVRSNKVYYTYRPFETAQKKYLYEEKLPIRHSEAQVRQGDPLVKQTD